MSTLVLGRVILKTGVMLKIRRHQKIWLICLDSLIMKNIYDLRNNGINFQLDKPKTNFLKKSISYSGAKCWNNLPNEIKAKEMTMGQFKTFLRENDNIR